MTKFFHWLLRANSHCNHPTRCASDQSNQSSTGYYVPTATATGRRMDKPSSRVVSSTGYYVPTATATSALSRRRTRPTLFHWLLRANSHCNREKYRLLMSNSDTNQTVFLETHDLRGISLEFRILARRFQSKALTNSYAWPTVTAGDACPGEVDQGPSYRRLLQCIMYRGRWR